MLVCRPVIFLVNILLNLIGKIGKSIIALIILIDVINLAISQHINLDERGQTI